ncbi:MAG: LytR C-terminal domain-containing protein, partial [Thermoleophilaceae bacterium]|nr:LytR C-terminal domain-containing protein [Thermoleophilaceae bacterium]
DRPADPEKNRKEPTFDTGQVTVTVLDGSGIDGLGTETAKRLEKEGFKIDDIEDAAEEVEVTRVLFDKKEPSSRRFALAVKRNLLPTRSVIIEPFDEISDGLAGEGEVVVIVGPDLADDEF